MGSMNLIADISRPVVSQKDVLLGARIKVFDDEGSNSWLEGVVSSVEPKGGIGECLKIHVDRRVVSNVEQKVDNPSVMLVDTNIPMTRVTLTAANAGWKV